MNASATEWRPRSDNKHDTLNVGAKAFTPRGNNPGPTTLSVAASPFRPKQLCRFFIQGACRNGLNCPFLHHGGGLELEDDGKPGEEKQSKFLVSDGIVCDFGPGLVIRDIELGSPSTRSCTVVASNLSSLLDEYDVEARLSPFGELVGLTPKRTGNNTWYAIASFLEPDSAEAAALALNGSCADTWSSKVRGKNGKTAILVSVKNDSTTKKNQGVLVKVEWYAPSKVAWVHFSRRFQAEKAAEMCNGLQLQRITWRLKLRCERSSL